MKKTAQRQFALSVLYSVSAIGFGLAAYEGRGWPFVVACAAYVWGHLIARRLDDD